RSIEAKQAAPLCAISAKAVALFRQGLQELNPYKMRDIKIALADALGRSKFRASPLDARPRSLIGCDTEPVEVVLDLRTELMKRIGEGAGLNLDPGSLPLMSESDS